MFASVAVFVQAPLQVVGNEVLQTQPPLALQTWFVAHLKQVAPLAPQLVGLSLASGSHAVALLQHPAQPEEALQTHCEPEPIVPAGHWQLPLTQLPKGHAPHVAPPVPVPHICVVWLAGATQVLPLQQPEGHDAASHLTAHAPPKQISFVPHAATAVPSCTLLVKVHFGPELHDIVPFWQGLLPGLQDALVVHAVHVPALQTPAVAPLVHDVPSAAAAFVSMHVAMPFVQAVTVPT